MATISKKYDAIVNSQFEKTSLPFASVEIFVYSFFEKSLF